MTTNTRPRTLHRARAPEAILDLLDIDGGVWTINQLAERLGRPRPTVSRAVARLLKDGRIRRLPYNQRLDVEALYRA